MTEPFVNPLCIVKVTSSVWIAQCRYNKTSEVSLNDCDTVATEIRCSELLFSLHEPCIVYCFTSFPRKTEEEFVQENREQTAEWNRGRNHSTASLLNSSCTIVITALFFLASLLLLLSPFLCVLSTRFTTFTNNSEVVCVDMFHSWNNLIDLY